MCKILLEGESIAHTFGICLAKCRFASLYNVVISGAQVKSFHLVAWELTAEELEKLGICCLAGGGGGGQVEERRSARRAGLGGCEKVFGVE